MSDPPPLVRARSPVFGDAFHLKLAEAPEDFVVDEVPLYPPCGDGEHTFVRVEKRLCNTEQVARALARAAGVRPRDIGYAGRKDRVAVTRQWLSVPGLAPEQALALEGEGWKVLEATPHRHKLRTGQLRENRFELVVRELAPEELAHAERSLPEIEERGFPNRFGPQRFGREGDNAQRGQEILLSGRMGRDKRQARFLVSAFQAELFNACLDHRSLPLDRVVEGEIAWKHDSGATFLVEDEMQENVRAEAFEISPSGPIVGTRMPQPEGRPGEEEAEWLRSRGLPDPLVPPRGLRLRGGRRPLRVRASDLSWEPVSASALRLVFSLPPGSYATVLIASIFGDRG
ncbi:MAG: tRNA pseudouridine(13) synthase TruD [bacterium]|nr:tRNA pseudouridine(13) synthase TruD [bacterium]MCP5070653.1 tRNA pseudouridine(13) synthase TruD [bacterium]